MLRTLQGLATQSERIDTPTTGVNPDRQLSTETIDDESKEKLTKSHPYARSKDSMRNFFEIFSQDIPSINLEAEMGRYHGCPYAQFDRLCYE